PGQPVERLEDLLRRFGALPPAVVALPFDRLRGGVQERPLEGARAGVEDEGAPHRRLSPLAPVSPAAPRAPPAGSSAPPRRGRRAPGGRGRRCCPRRRRGRSRDRCRPAPPSSRGSASPVSRPPPPGRRA